MRNFIFVIVLSISLVSCNRSGLISGVPIEEVKPERVISISCDTSFDARFPELLDCHALELIGDTSIVFQEQVNENNPLYFKVYSTSSFRYLGSFAYHGRGPKEMIAPHIAENCVCNEFLAINDNPTGKAYFVDVEKSFTFSELHIVNMYELPSNTFDWLPLSIDRQLVLMHEKTDIVLSVRDRVGQIYNTFNIFQTLNADPFFLSSFWVHNGDASGLVAQVMICIPQINIINLSTGEVRSIAVNRAWSKWENIVKSRVNKNFMEYYVCATATPDYIFAAYRGRSLGETNEDGTAIHILDWNGQFLYVLNVAEDIVDVAYDQTGGFLYCIERSENKVVRYDVKEILM